jgi:ribonuclease Z
MSHIFIQRIIDNLKIPLVGTPYYVTGESVAARYTTIYINGLNIMFDCGQNVCEKKPTHVFISHVHADHVRGLSTMLIDKPQKGKDNINVIVPSGSVKFLKKYIDSFFNMTKHCDTHNKIYWNLIDVYLPNDDDITQYFMKKNIILNKLEFKVELFKCKHTIPTTGYGLIEIRNKLDNKYKGLSQKQLEELKKSGTDINKTIEIPHFCYLGDTTHHVFYTDKECTIYNTHIEKYKNILVECTFIELEDEKIAKDKKHMHWINLKKYIDNHLDINFILYHFSMKYDISIIKMFFTIQKYSNVQLLIHDFEPK